VHHPEVNGAGVAARPRGSAARISSIGPRSGQCMSPEAIAGLLYMLEGRVPGLMVGSRFCRERQSGENATAAGVGVAPPALKDASGGGLRLKYDRSRGDRGTRRA